MWHHEKKLSQQTQKLPLPQGKGAIAWLFCLGLVFSQGGSAESVQLAWDPVQDSQVAVYQVHFGPASGQYNNMLDTDVNMANIQGLQPGSTYYFAVRACDSSQANCSGFSNEVSTTIQIPSPAASFTTNTVSGAAPLTVLFTDTSTGTITGRNWQFHDGDSATDATLVTHTYTVPGTYTAQLSVTGPGGSDTFVASTPIVVQPPSNTDGNGSDGSDDSSNDGSGNDGTGNMYNPAAIDFNAHTLVPFPRQDRAGGAVIEDGGSTLRLTGNTWKRMAYPYTVTGSTVIEFDYRSELLGEIHAIGFDNEGSTGAVTLRTSFQLGGSESWGIMDYSYLGDGSWVHVRIPVGQHYGGNFDNLVFIMDDDADSAGDARFRNLVVHEGTLSNTPPVLTVAGPVSGSSYVAGELIIFDASASDAEDGDQSGQIAWYSDLDGALGMGVPLSMAGLSVGSHTVTVSVTDDQGAVAQQTLTVVVTPVQSGPAPIDFNAHTLVSFPGQDLAGGAVIEDGGSTLRLTGNTWKRMAYPYTVTGSTVIEFDYRSDLLGEIHGIGFDNGGARANPARFFALEGTQDWGISSYSYPGDGGWVRVWIPVGQHYGGNFDNLVFIMDDDADAAGDARFRNLVVHEGTLSNTPPVLTVAGPVSGSSYVAGQLITFDASASDAEDGDQSGRIAWYSDLDGALGMGVPLSMAGLSVGSHTVTVSVTDDQGAVAQQALTVVVTPVQSGPAPIDFNAHTLVPFPRQDRAGGAVIEDGGSTLRLIGNTWKRMAYPYTVTESTVIEFDYRSELLGEIHAIGFDNEGSTGAVTLRTSFQLGGSESWGIMDYSYLGDGSWVHVRIPVGQHYGGNFDNLVFIMDDDGDSAGDARFRDLVLYEE